MTTTRGQIIWKLVYVCRDCHDDEIMTYDLLVRDTFGIWACGQVLSDNRSKLTNPGVTYREL